MYKIVKYQNPKEVEIEVSEMLESGNWLLAGNLVVEEKKDIVWFCQPMVKKEFFDTIRKK